MAHSKKKSRKLSEDELKLAKALKEDIQIRMARTSFKHFCEYVDWNNPKFCNGTQPHLEVLYKELQEAYEGYLRGEEQNLLISLIPGGGKSFIISLFCLWCLGKHPDRSVMRNTYGQELSVVFSRLIRNTIASNEAYKKVFQEIELSDDNKSVQAWSLKGSSKENYISASVGSAVTGRRANLLLILDDPFKDWDSAQSPKIRETTWNWYTSTHNTRVDIIKPIKIVIATRWHTEDITGLLIEKESEYWKQIVIPAIGKDKDGNIISNFPEKHSLEEFERIRKQNPVTFNPLYMQKPANIEGVLFKASELKTFTLEDIKYYEPTAVVGYIDTADRGTDSLASVIGYMINDEVYIVDVVFTQDPIEVTEPLVVEQIMRHEANLVTVESNAGGRSFAKNIKTSLKENKCKTKIEEKHTTQNKETRILMKSGQIKENFYFRTDYEVGSDYDKFITELTSYSRLGRNKHDDAPDSVTGLAEMLFEGKLAKRKRLMESMGL